MTLRERASNPSTNDLLIAGGVAVAAYLLLNHRSGPDIDDLVEPPQPQTLPDAELSGIAEEIHASFWEGDGLYEDEAGMVAALLRCGNNRDVYKVIQYYGRREGPYLGNGEYTLFGAFATALNDDEAQVLNDALFAKGITYRF